ncbi:MAG TPA: hypothetical protein VLB47_15075 [Solirubrobacteraceae bacterium]|nr:hypothetical protein [Solirubrobacteraceae bacterium]
MQRSRDRRGRRLGLVVAVAALAAAVADQLRRPAAERDWHGRALGLVPYDLRPPTAGRVRRALWNPGGPLLGPHPVGVGWTLNLGRVARLLGLA